MREAVGPEAFSIRWNQERVEPVAGEDYFFLDSEAEALLGAREAGAMTTLTEAWLQSSPDFGAEYLGDWLKCSWTRQGQGCLTRTNGERYSGCFLDNQFHGKGKFWYAEGDKEGRQSYVGQFASGAIHGCGIMTYRNGDSCAIRRVGDTMVGQAQGVYSWANGVQARVTSHDGAMLFDLPLVFPEEDFRAEYAGAFLTEGPVLHGHGTLTLKNGKTFAGNWVDGQLVDDANEV